jgi:hypothetical protein
MFLSNLLLVAVVSLVVWVLGFFGFHVGGSLIHIVLLVGIISLALHGGSRVLASADRVASVALEDRRHEPDHRILLDTIWSSAEAS